MGVTAVTAGYGAMPDSQLQLAGTGRQIFSEYRLTFRYSGRLIQRHLCFLTDTVSEVFKDDHFCLHGHEAS